MITRAKISAVRANSFVVVEQFNVFPGYTEFLEKARHRGCGAYSRAVLIYFFVLDAALIWGRRLIEGGAYSSKYGTCNAFEWYTMEYLTSHLYFLVYTQAFRWVMSGLFHGIPRERVALIKNFMSCHRKYSGQMERLGVIQFNCPDRWEGTVEYWRIYDSFPAFWLAVFSMAWYKIWYQPCKTSILIGNLRSLDCPWTLLVPIVILYEYFTACPLYDGTPSNGIVSL